MSEHRKRVPSGHTLLAFDVYSEEQKQQECQKAGLFYKFRRKKDSPQNFMVFFRE